MPLDLSLQMLLAERHWIEQLARRIVEDPGAAEDAAQDTMRRALERPPTTVASPRGWLRSVLRSSVREVRRSETRRRGRERAASRAEAAPSTVDLVARADAHRRVLAAVLALDGPSREVVLLRFFENLSPTEIATRRSEPAATVRSRLSRALGVLRERLEREYGGGRGALAAALLGPDAMSMSATQGMAKGVLVMTATTKTLVAAGALALTGFLLWDGDRGDAGTRPPPAGAGAATGAEEASAPPGLRAAPLAGQAQSGEPHPVPAPTPLPLAPAAEGRMRLTLRPLPPPEPARAADPADGRRPTGSGDPVGGGEEARGAAVGIGSAGPLVLAKWRPVPERGTARLAGRVTDVLGVPLAGAQILRLEPAAGGGEGDVCPLGACEVVGTTTGDGTFDLAAQPARSVHLAANWHETMTRPGGLLLSGVVEIAPRENSSLTGIELRLPFDTREFGTVAGRVVDDLGEPLRVEVSVGFMKSMADAAGRFTISPVGAGKRMVSVEAYGYRPAATPVKVRANAEVSVEVRVSPVRRGAHAIEGGVADDDGGPVAGVGVYCGGVEGVYLRGTTGPDGSFRFRGLPQAPEGASYWIAVEGEDIVRHLERGIAAPSSGLSIRIQRSHALRLWVRDAATGSAIPLFNVTLTPPPGAEDAADSDLLEDAVQHDRTSAVYAEDGALSLRVPRGESILLVEAPDHEPVRASIDVPRGGHAFEVVVEMRR